jgi:DNA-binding NarL/FixJ family response regulator
MDEKDREFSFSIDGREAYLLRIDLQHGLVDTLTPAELEVAGLLLHGYSNREIAGLRGTALNTVANQVRAVYHKLGVHSRSELAAVIGSEPSSEQM